VRAAWPIFGGVTADGVGEGKMDEACTAEELEDP